jgi:hypothetical protein
MGKIRRIEKPPLPKGFLRNNSPPVGGGEFLDFEKKYHKV